ncbi:MAG: hypothetical protein ACLRWP_07845 [Bilophila wadsworthia]
MSADVRRIASFALYAGGAMKHKNETMQRGGERKGGCGGRDHAGRG